MEHPKEDYAAAHNKEPKRRPSRGKMSFDSTDHTWITTSKLEGPDLVWTEEMIARERRFRDELIVGPSVTELAEAFCKGAKSLELSIAAFQTKMLALVTEDDDNPGDIARYTERLTSVIKSCKPIENVRVVQGSGTHVQATRTVWWTIKRSFCRVRCWAGAIEWDKRDGETDVVRVTWKGMVHRLCLYERRLSLILEPLPALGRVALCLNSRRMKGTNDFEPALAMKLYEATLDEVATATVRSRQVYEGSDFAISEEYRNICKEWLDDNISFFQSKWLEVDTKLNSAIVAHQPDNRVSTSRLLKVAS
jgi:hypothetical protein